MTDSEKLAVLVEFLKKEANEPCWDMYAEDYYAGGNEDDAFYGGVDAGRVEVAAEALALIGEPD